MKETVISWTAANFVTIALMMIISSAVIGAVTKAVVGRRAKSDD